MTPDQLIKLYESRLRTCEVILADKCTRPNDRDIAFEKKKLIEEFINYLKNIES